MNVDVFNVSLKSLNKKFLLATTLAKKPYNPIHRIYSILDEPSTVISEFCLLHKLK